MGSTGRYHHLTYQTGSQDVQAPTYRAADQPPEVVHETEFTQLLAAHPATSIRNARIRVVLALMYLAGLRSGEVRRLERSQVMLDSDNPRLEVRGSKGGRGRNIHLDERLATIIREWYLLAPPSQYVVCTYANTKPGVFTRGNPVGSMVSQGVVWDITQRATRRAGITRHLRPHMFRHAAATRWLSSGVFTVADVQRLLGHAKIATTQRYLHVSDAELAEKMDRFSRIFNAPPDTKLCPYCEHRIKREAIVCRYCREDLPKTG